MTVPSRAEAASLLLSLDPPAWHARHSRAVAEVAAWIADRIAANAHPIDRRVVDAAALLHDIDKLLPSDEPARALVHGAGSAAWLERRGFGELAEAVARHPVTTLGAEHAEEWLESASIEALVVSYADKRAGQELEPMTERFREWAGRYPDGWPRPVAERAWRLAEQLEARVCGLAGVKPEEVERLPWVDAAAATRTVGAA
jgi:HD superfamily phosphodiesterase